MPTRHNDFLSDKNLGEIYEFNTQDRITKDTGGYHEVGEKFLYCGNVPCEDVYLKFAIKFIDLQTGMISLWAPQYIVYFRKIC